MVHGSFKKNMKELCPAGEDLGMLMSSVVVNIRRGGQEGGKRG
jgi:hypothetical protein